MSCPFPSPLMSSSDEIKNLLDQHIYQYFKGMSQNGRVMAEYIWIDGSGENLRSKTKTLTERPKTIDQVPLWNFDGSSTDQAKGNDSEVYLNPVAMYADPLRGDENILVLCETYEPPRVDASGNAVTAPKPLPSNTRYACSEVMEQAKEHEPWFGIEQEYTLLDSRTQWPLGWPVNGFPQPQGPYYCSVGTGRAVGRAIVECHYKACLCAGISISGVNAEVMPAQWEYQVGPCAGIEMGDQLWISRFLMLRICEMFNVVCSFDPKPIPGDWNGAGGHCNYSNNATRKRGSGWDAIQEQIEQLRQHHAEHIRAYGKGIERRLTGTCEASSMTEFTWGVADRGASIRVGTMVPVERCGYFEDRRPASNLDPYIVTKLIVEGTLLTQ